MRRLLLFCVLLLTLPWAQPAEAHPRSLLPIVFVHGNSGSATQFETQFQRFTANGYPQRLLYAYEYDSSQPSDAAAVAGLDVFLDRVRSSGKVLLVAHSRGTGISQAYLADPAHAAKVARYVNLDGRSAAAPPGGVPTLALWGEWQSPPDPVLGVVGSIGGATNIYHRDFGHTETVSSPVSFAEMYRFLLGCEPRTTAVTPSRGALVRVAGRTVIFPQNVGFAGATLQVWPVDPWTGRRISRAPMRQQAVDAVGAFGPLTLLKGMGYEFAVVRPGGTVHHFYQRPFVRDDYFVRLNSAPAGTGLETLLPRGPEHVGMVLLRAREMWGDQGADNDVLTVNGLNVLTPQVSPRSSNRATPTGNVGENNALFISDVGAALPGGTGYLGPDRQTDLTKGQLFPFNTLTFLSAADVYVPARGTVRLAMRSRGSHVTTAIGVPAWPSDQHRVTVSFPDH